jgi:uncharacterized phiE125 gp8 family phage protein
MSLIDLVPVPDAALPVALFRAHLRLGTGFADSASQDAALAGHLRAAIAVIEGRIGKALILRNFRLVVVAWRWPDCQVLPIAPVSAVQAVQLFDAAGVAYGADPARWRLFPDPARPRLVAGGALLPTIPQGGRAEVTFTAGLAADWAALPGDLAQAVLLLAAQFYDGRTGETPALPAPVAQLLARWQPVRLGGAL